MVEKLQVCRAIVKELLASIPVATTYYEGQPGGIFMERVRTVKELSREITITYKYLMQEIAGKCIAFLGQPPCKSAMVALGSFARQEITLYSDFEHVIVLEDGLESSNNSEEIREYFRWFATVFQVLIIGFGETFIRSVGVRSLNDLYSEDNSRNWYYDSFTPCGIAFDGMVPHSCNNPLGRQEKTRARRHKLELIQTAQKMAQYLSRDEEVKNGYYLKDMLVRTGFVHGSYDVYDSFSLHSKSILQAEESNTIIPEHLEKIHENVNKHISMAGFPYREEEDVEQSVYRPITTLLSYVARMHTLSTGSTTTSFSIVNELQRKGVFEESIARRVEYSVAVVIELRMRVYSVFGNQRALTTNERSAELVGMKAVVDCREMAQYLSEVAHLAATGGQRFYTPKRSHPRRKIVALYNMRQFVEAKRCADMATGKLDQFTHEILMIKGSRCYFGQAIVSPLEYVRRKYLKEAADTFEEALKTSLIDRHASLKFSCYRELKECYKMLGNEILEEKISTALKKWQNGISYGADKLAKTDLAVIAGMSLGEQYEQRIDEIRQAMESGENTVKRSQLQKMSLEIVENCGEIQKIFMPMLLIKLAYLQEDNGWSEDALKTIDLLLETTKGVFPELPSYRHFAKGLKKKVGGDVTFSCLLEAIEHRKAHMLLKLGKYDACLAYIEGTTLYKKVWVHALTASACFMGKTRSACAIELKRQYVEKAISYLKCVQALAVFESHYNAALRQLLLFVDAAAIIRHFREAPASVKKTAAYQAMLCNFMVGHSRYIAHIDRENALRNWKLIRDSFPGDLMRPFGYFIYSSILLKRVQRSQQAAPGEIIWYSPLNKLRERFVLKNQLRGSDKVLTAYNKAVEHFSYLHVRASGVFLWNILISCKVNSFLYRSALTFLLASLLLGITEWRNLELCCCMDTGLVVVKEFDKFHDNMHLLGRLFSNVVARIRKIEP